MSTIYRWLFSLSLIKSGHKNWELGLNGLKLTGVRSASKQAWVGETAGKKQPKHIVLTFAQGIKHETAAEFRIPATPTRAWTLSAVCWPSCNVVWYTTNRWKAFPRSNQVGQTEKQLITFWGRPPETQTHIATFIVTLNWLRFQGKTLECYNSNLLMKVRAAERVRNGLQPSE